jgi:hypothetical protein
VWPGDWTRDELDVVAADAFEHGWSLMFADE